MFSALHDDQTTIFCIEPYDLTYTIRNLVPQTCNKKCQICDKKIITPKIKLHCQCEYHLQCFLNLDDTIQCFNCHDKIVKENDEDYQMCSICLELLKDDVTKLACSHSFHETCMRQWHASSRENANTDKCPICRKSCSCLF
jgi:hypothetical protein